MPLDHRDPRSPESAQMALLWLHAKFDSCCLAIHSFPILSAAARTAEQTGRPSAIRKGRTWAKLVGVDK